MKDWWLDSVCKDEWDVLIVEEDGLIVAALPYAIKRKFFLKVIGNAKFTHRMGIWIKTKYVNQNKQLSYVNEIISNLILRIPKFDYFELNFNYQFRYWLPFYWNGFKQTTNYTYIVDGLSKIDNLNSIFDSSYKNKINKAKKIVRIIDDLPPRDFYKINEKTFLRQGLNIPYTETEFLLHDKALSDNNSRIIFSAIDSEENVHSALYLTFDNTTAYVHFVGEDPNFRSSGAGILLIHHAMQYTQKTLCLDVFDFEGSMIRGVERVRRDCGGKPVEYYSISKNNSTIIELFKFLYFITDKVKRICS